MVHCPVDAPPKMSGEIDLERLGQTSSNGEVRKGVHDDDRQSQDVEKEQPSSSNLMYDIDTSPPWHLAVMLGFQVRSWLLLSSNLVQSIGS